MLKVLGLAAAGVLAFIAARPLMDTGETLMSSPAAQDVAQRAENAQYAMGQAARSASAVEHARIVVGGSPDDAQIELVHAEGSGARGEVILRIRSTVTDDGPYGNDSSALACYRYRFGDAGISAPDEVRCPAAPAMKLLGPPQPVLLPAGADQVLADALSAPDPAAALDAGFYAPEFRSETVVVEGVVAAAVADQDNACVAGRRLADGSVETWFVPRIVAMPGELGCHAVDAVDARNAESPH